MHNVSGIPRPTHSPTYLESACLDGKYWSIQKDEDGPLSQCVVSVIFRGAPSVVFMVFLLLDVFRGFEKPLVKAPLSFTFTMKLISIFILFVGCFLNLYCWVSLYKDEDYVVVSEEVAEMLQAYAWLLSGISLYLGYNRAREQSVCLRLYISIESFMSLLLLFLRPKGFRDNVLDNANRPLYYIVLLDVVRVLSNLLLAFFMAYYPRDVPEYSDIVIQYKDMSLENRTNSSGNDYYPFRASRGDSSSSMTIFSGGTKYGSVSTTSSNSNSYSYSNCAPHDIHYLSDSTDGEDQFSPTTQDNINHMKRIKNALRKGSMEYIDNHVSNIIRDGNSKIYNSLLHDGSHQLPSSV